MSIAADPAGPADSPPARLSPLERTARIFARPSAAWDDLKERGQWLFPFLVTLVLWVALQGLAFDHVTVPMMLDQWSTAVANGRMEPAQAQQMEQFFTGNPAARWIVLTQQAIFWPIAALFQALIMWFGAGFVLGTRFKFRQAFDVTLWSGLVKIPQLLLFFVLAFQRQSFQGVHLGLGMLVPEPETPNKLLTGLTTFLDFLGPFEVWWGIVVILGVSALTGAPRRNVAWVLVSLYLAFGVLFAAANAFFNPGA